MTYNVFVKIKHTAPGGPKAPPVIKPRRLWLKGFTTREEADKYARLAVEHEFMGKPVLPYLDTSDP